MTADNHSSFAKTRSTCEDSRSIISTPKQVLQGHPVDSKSNTTLCIGCGIALHETDIVFAYACRCADSVQWDVPRVYCRDCAPDKISSPTLGITEVLVGGRLGTIAFPTPRKHQLCLTELATRAFSPPEEGSAP
ncbi:hypothetical protein E2L06_10690 [Haloterrigena sp. H1]|nr:hypothetical protein E2L06_10690 [Haloterrigena sp. H1]